MSRTHAAAAILISALTLVGAPALAGGQTAAPAPADQRAMMDRLDPMARSVFWNREYEINPADPVAGVKLASALRELGQYDQAAQTAQSVLTGQPNNIEAMLELGKDHIARGQGFYGIAALEQARASAPNDWRPLSLLGVAYTQVRREDDARAAWNEGLRVSPDNPGLTNAAVALMTAGNLPGAEGLLRRAVAQPGATSRMRLNLAMALGLQGRMPEAEQIIRRDLPPEQADSNLQWLRSKTAAGASVMPVSLPANQAESSNTARTWSSLQGQ